MSDKWIGRFIVLIILLALPISIFSFAYPELSKADFSNYPYMPSLLAVLFILLVIGDVGGIILLVRGWMKET